MAEPAAYPPPRSEIVVVGGKRTRKCLWEGCGKTAGDGSLSQFIRHWRIHTKEKPFVCDHPGCGYACTQQGSLISHKRVHNGETPFKCHVLGCEKAFKTSGNLHTHARTHSGDKPYKCNHPGCDYTATQQTHLESHKRTHMKERPYICDYAGCNYTAVFTNNLAVHKRIHTKQKPYVCDYDGCNYSARFASNLVSHKRIHTGEKPYVCDVCDYACAVSSTLQLHVMRHHNATYVARKKEQEERVRKALLDADWKEWFHPELLPPAGYFKREHKIDFECAAASADRQSCRIDFILGYNGPSYVFLEVDEHQHRFGYRQADGAAISCDAKRMGSVHTSLAVEFGKLGRDVPPIYWLRYNPHEWHVDGVTMRLPKADRETRLVAFLDKYEAIAPLRIGYSFYDTNDEGGFDVLDVLLADEFPESFRDDGIVDNLRDFAAGEPELVTCLPC